MKIVAGAEQLVNTTTYGYQTPAEMAILADGGWIATWRSDEGTSQQISAQRFNSLGAAVGGEFRVNTDDAWALLKPQVVGLSDGGWSIIWETQTLATPSDQEVRSKTYNADGTVRTVEASVNTFSTGYQYDAELVARDGGGWVVAWSSQHQDDADLTQGVYAQAFYNSGARYGLETRVNTTTAGDQYQQEVASLEGGGWVVVWNSPGEDGDGSGLYVQAYSADGAVVFGVPPRVNTYTARHQDQPVITGIEGGGWVIAWRSLGQDATNSDGVYAQAFNANGTLRGGEVQVHTTTAENQNTQQITALDTGGWVITWQNGWFSICQQVFDATGAKVGGETQVNTYAAAGQWNPVITALVGGGWVTAWESQGQDGSNLGCYARVYNANGTPAGDVFRLNQTTANDQSGIKIIATSDGFVASWVGDDAQAKGVYQRVYHLENAIGLGPTDISGKLKWTEGKSGVVGTLKTVDVDDTAGFTWILLDDAGGRFAINSATGKITVAKPVLLDFEQAKKHSLTVQVTDNDGNSFTKALKATGNDVAIEDLSLTSKADKVFGGSKVDTFKGLGGNDTMRGGGGKDVLDGGKGKDTADYSDKNKSVDVTLNKSHAVTVKVDGKAEDSIKNIENIIGGWKADRLTGDGASNIFDGGGGKDTMKGAGGKDFFVFDTALGAQNVDTIVGFKPKDDTIRLDHDIFTMLSPGDLPFYAFTANTTGEATDEQQRIIYQTTTGKLFYDADGIHTGASHQLIAVLTGKPALTEAHIEVV